MIKTYSYNYYIFYITQFDDDYCYYDQGGNDVDDELLKIVLYATYAASINAHYYFIRIRGYVICFLKIQISTYQLLVLVIAKMLAAIVASHIATTKIIRQ